MSFIPLKNLIPQTTTPITPSNSPSERGRSTFNSPSERGRNILVGQLVFKLFRAALQEICGEVVSAQVHPLYINNNTLVVACFTAATHDVLGLKEKEIIDKVNGGLRTKFLEHIQLIG